ncbi:MAG: hypothetical protein DRH11_13160 [Deltaproteobacteria bacterium]|nr:MAG: hypothetical protein DRH11_13160 [Deltaproteobacteria bacterium]
MPEEGVEPSRAQGPLDFESDTIILAYPNCLAISTTCTYPNFSFSTGCSPGAFFAPCLQPSIASFSEVNKIYFIS